MYTDAGFWSMILAAIVGTGLMPLYLFRVKIKEWWNRAKGKKQLP